MLCKQVSTFTHCGLILTFEVANGDFSCYNCEKNIDNNVIFHLRVFRSPNSNLTEHDRKIPPLPPLFSTYDSSNPTCTPRRLHQSFCKQLLTASPPMLSCKLCGESQLASWLLCHLESCSATTSPPWHMYIPMSPPSTQVLGHVLASRKSSSTLSHCQLAKSKASALHLWAVPANDMELTTVEKPFAFNALPCYVRKRAHSSFTTSYTNACRNSSRIKIIKIHNVTPKIHFIICLLIPRNSRKYQWIKF